MSTAGSFTRARWSEQNQRSGAHAADSWLVSSLGHDRSKADEKSQNRTSKLLKTGFAAHDQTLADRADLKWGGIEKSA